MGQFSFSRRNFLRSAGIGAASIWIPKEVSGYSAEDLEAFQVDGRLEVGISKWDLETPALCLDLDKLERNVAQMQRVVTANGIATRPHAKTHKTPAIAHLQMQTGSIGVCAAKLGEAEVMLQHGIDQVLMTTANISPSKIRRAMALRRWHEGFIQAVDNPQNAQDLSDAAVAAGVVADVVVDVCPGTRTGIPPGEPALQLGQLVDRLPGLRLRGIVAYSAGAQHVVGFAARRQTSLESMVPQVETVELFKRSGLDTGIFSGGGTGTYNIDHEIPHFTDLQVGSYVFMDNQYIDIGGAANELVYDDFEPSLTVLATILNTNFPGRATADAGAKALTLNEPPARIVGTTGITYTSRSDEFGSIRYEANASKTFRTGEKIEMIVPHCDPVVNLYDRMYGIRGEMVEVIWPISARGHSV